MVIAALVVSATLVAGAPAAYQAATAGGSYKPVGKWGKAGGANGQFNNAFGLATDAVGTSMSRTPTTTAFRSFRPRGHSCASGARPGAETGILERPGRRGQFARQRIRRGSQDERVQVFGSGGGFQLRRSTVVPNPVGSGSTPRGISTWPSSEGSRATTRHPATPARSRGEACRRPATSRCLPTGASTSPTTVPCA